MLAALKQKEYSIVEFKKIILDNKLAKTRRLSKFKRARGVWRVYVFV